MNGSKVILNNHYSRHCLSVSKEDEAVIINDGQTDSVPLSYVEAEFLLAALTEYLSVGKETIEAMHSQALIEILDEFDRPGEQPKKPIKDRDKSGHVYLIQSPTGAWKIGRTSNPEDRMATFGLRLPIEVKYVCLIPTDDMYALERKLQSKYIDKLINGEWFALSPADVEEIKALAL